MGLFWYLFLEMFDHFREFFILVFQLNAFFYVIPLSSLLRYLQLQRWYSYEIPVTFNCDFANILLLINCTNFAFSIFRNDAVFLFYTLSSVIAIFKSYPTFGDFSIPFALLISWSHLYPCTFLFSRLHCLTRYLIETFTEMKDITY
jgi:phosphatidylinositol glycan class U